MYGWPDGLMTKRKYEEMNETLNSLLLESYKMHRVRYLVLESSPLSSLEWLLEYFSLLNKLRMATLVTVPAAA